MLWQCNCCGMWYDDSDNHRFCPIRDFDSNSVHLKEQATAQLQAEAAHCFFAVKMGSGKIKDVAGKWGCSGSSIRRRAKLWEDWGEDLRADLPLSLYEEITKLAPKVGKAPAVLLRFAESKGLTSTAKLRKWYADYAGIEEIVIASWSGEADVEEWNPSEDRVTLRGLGISGERREKVQATVKEVS